MKTRFSYFALHLWLILFLVVGMSTRYAEGDDLDKYQELIKRNPFVPPAPPAPVIVAPPTMSKYTLNGFFNFGDTVKVGIENTTSIPSKSYLLKAGQSEENGRFVIKEIHQDEKYVMANIDGQPVKLQLMEIKTQFSPIPMMPSAMPPPPLPLPMDVENPAFTNPESPEQQQQHQGDGQNPTSAMGQNPAIPVVPEATTPEVAPAPATTEETTAPPMRRGRIRIPQRTN